DFGHGTPSKRDNRRSGRHRFDLNQAERFRPVDWEQQGRGIAEKRAFVGFADLADELNQRILQQWQDLTLEIGTIRGVDLGGNLQGHPGPLRNFYRAIGTFLWRDPAEKGEIPSTAITKPEKAARQPMIHRGLPI